ncbi:hypothetical protein MCUN1_002152 [Malassezia cuniculi]|uniref:SH3 domain-containing protein n=1 Tax=Malassezia cuniculi TaxID=948313 RepID=A0AAF0ERI2_9BASI|nr:hypothetical protein MCUN1_002152 [Malassezia cuniculi]
MSDASSGTSEASDTGQSSALSDTMLDTTLEEMSQQRRYAQAAPAQDAHTTLRAAMDSGIASVRDFAFPTDDERHAGVGSVIPRTRAGHVALYDFIAESENELSVAAGEPVLVLRESDAGWVVAQTNSAGRVRRGLVPEAYLGATS